jgi:hypothetical protein
MSGSVRGLEIARMIEDMGRVMWEVMGPNGKSLVNFCVRLNRNDFHELHELKPSQFVYDFDPIDARKNKTYWHSFYGKVEIERTYP